MMHKFTVGMLSALPISADNAFVRVDKYGRDLSADWDIYILDSTNHWVWAGYA